ncbi:hypothetical protein ACI2KR_06625 [Pseudomonas luteola]
MRTSSPAALQALGMTGSSCPVTNVRSPNVSRVFGDFSISYNPRSSGYGCPTTAIVLQERVFFVLNGNHAEPLCNAANNSGLQGAIDYFIENIAQANAFSEHPMAIGLSRDQFGLFETALEVVGQHNINRIAQAVA